MADIEENARREAVGGTEIALSLIAIEIVRRIPAEGVGRDLGSAAGESLPHQYRSGTLMLEHFLIGDGLNDLHIHLRSR